MHWLGPYVIKEITDGRAAQLVKLNGEPFPLGSYNNRIHNFELAMISLVILYILLLSEKCFPY